MRFPSPILRLISSGNIKHWVLSPEKKGIHKGTGCEDNDGWLFFSRHAHGYLNSKGALIRKQLYTLMLFKETAEGLTLRRVLSRQKQFLLLPQPLLSSATFVVVVCDSSGSINCDLWCEAGAFHSIPFFSSSSLW
ncbi:hypothetical protein AVEN_246827-1 [Araneus ventricosus]|uniref:Uncharacterized protein n=1 Tax=Araneus ventricosus TaxID=182803 RepID=A0A4Y2T809_ARAVE|nr:hypothetical protein AVEN_29680-1 [Araneus ventricosus]GBN96779.1 hypothetical protein AVEN_246827-1 [Araneus ventricosus]